MAESRGRAGAEPTVAGIHDGTVSRRALLQAGALLAVGVPGMSRADDDHPPRAPILAYVGTYTPNGPGIQLCSLDPGSGLLALVKVAAAVTNPSWLELNPQGTCLYAVNEISNYNGGRTGSVTAFAVNRSTGDLTLLNVVSSQGAGPAHVSVDPLGQFAFVANYGGGSVAVLPILPDGSLGDATDVKTDVGAVGPTTATNAPPGSFAISGHDAPHPLMIAAHPGGQFVVSADLGQDRLWSWVLDRSAGQLVPNGVPYTALPPGDGPRHVAFHPNGKWLYSIQEEASTLGFFAFDSLSGTLAPQQTLSTLPAKFAGTSFASEVRVSRNGRFVYAANRLLNTISIYAVDVDTGLLRRVGDEWVRGDYPRSFTLDPTGRFLFVCNQRSDAVTGFRLGDGGRELHFTGQYIGVGSPACMAFLT